MWKNLTIGALLILCAILGFMAMRANKGRTEFQSDTIHADHGVTASPPVSEHRPTWHREQQKGSGFENQSVKDKTQKETTADRTSGIAANSPVTRVPDLRSALLKAIIERGRDPSAIAAQMARAKDRFQQDYCVLLDYLKLPEDSAAKLRELHLKKMDVRGKKSKNDMDEQIHQLLGDDAYEVYKSYEETMPQRRFVWGVREKLIPGGLDMSTEQEHNLIVGMYTEDAALPRPAGNMTGLAALSASNQSAMLEEAKQLAEKQLAKAAAILTPEQLAVFREQQAEERVKGEFAVGTMAGIVELMGLSASNKTEISNQVLEDTARKLADPQH